MQAEPADNIAQDQVLPTSTHIDTVDTEYADYMRTFDEIGDHNDRIGGMIKTIDDQMYDQDRLREAINVIRELHEINNRMYTLLVEMNNVFGDPEHK